MIFISYSHKDREYVHKLQETLQREGFDVWVDDRIDYGTAWPNVIQDRLDSSDALILVMTTNSFKSNWVQNELAWAWQLRKPIFPLLLEGDIWEPIQAIQYIDVRDKSLPFEKFYRRLESVTRRNKLAPPHLTRAEPMAEKMMTKPLVVTPSREPLFNRIRRLLAGDSSTDAPFPKKKRK